MGVRERARRWLAEDPDPVTRAELQELLDRWPATEAELTARFAGRLTFGTAGLRGPVRAGPAGMNVAVVRAAAAGLMAWLADRGAAGPLVIGYDARHGSRRFAEETARVCTGAGRPALLLPAPLPTPVLAYAVRALDAVAGVMVTASHNPPGDNGYKVYLGAQVGGPTGAGAQIVSPVDAEIEAAIRAVGPLSTIPLGSSGTVVDRQIVDAYVDAAAAVVAPTAPRQLTVAYTPLHGVGGDTFVTAMRRAGFPTPTVVTDQATPDPDFPTVAFPNPEEPGAMDRVTALASRIGADIAIAHDPDADRCAVAVPDTDGWRTLHGDEVGVLLADHLMRRGVTGRYATTIVSSSMLRAMCAARGLPYTETLTGFKWIVRAGEDLVYGYEEALGYCVAPAVVRDKDGVTAALAVCELAADLAAKGRSLTDRLAELTAEFGVFATAHVSLRVPAPSHLAALMDRLRAQPPQALAGAPVTEVADLHPAADVLVWRTADSRVVVRPSGTEPKLKAYLEVVAPPKAVQRASAHLARLREQLHRLLSDAA